MRRVPPKQEIQEELDAEVRTDVEADWDHTRYCSDCNGDHPEEWITWESLKKNI